jgi:REP element-mobilizing transposase RayT
MIEPGCVYHFVARFVAKQWFIESEHERHQYLRLLGLSLEVSDWECIAFAVMSNHIHLCMVAGESPLASWARNPHSTFAEWMNERHERIGAVFTRGPSQRAVRLDGVANVIAYIHCNPVRAGVVAHARESTWTSHAAYLDRSKAPSWLRIDKGLELLGIADGTMLDAWVEGGALDRNELEHAMVAHRGPGRPKTRASEKWDLVPIRSRRSEMGSDPISGDYTSAVIT